MIFLKIGQQNSESFIDLMRKNNMEEPENTPKCDYDVVVMDSHEPRDIFCQMDILRQYNDDFVWKELHR